MERNRDAILELEESVEELDQQASEKPTLQQRLDYLRGQLRNPVFHLRGQWDPERTFMMWAGQTIQSFRRTAGSAPPSSAAPPPIPLGSPNPSITDEVRDVVVSLTRDLGQMLDVFQARVIGAEEQYQVVRAKWMHLDKTAEEQFQAALRQAGVAELQDLHREKVAKERLLHQIEEVVEPKLGQQREILRAQYASRSVLVSSLIECRDEMHRVRANQLSDLSARLRAIHVEIEPQGDRRAYGEYLQGVYRRAGIHNAESQLDRVVEHLRPHELADFILRKDAGGVAAATGVTAGTAGKIVSFLALDQVLELQTIDTPDFPTISLQRSEDNAFVPLQQLSIGERCSVVLTIALLEKNRPLIIDQPEDDLDHEFIVDDIVAGMKRIKETRQIIVATHDANVPVLGDAELVVRVAKKPGEERCGILVEGSLEDERVLPEVLKLDGGRGAFEQRRSKYMIA